MSRWLMPLAVVAVSVAPCPAAPTWKAGVAVQVITPEQPMWMSGYASRKKPAEGKDQDLFVKALALEDAKGGRVVLVTTDLVGIPRSLAEAVAADVQKKTGLPRERLMLTVSHTHCGPVVRDNLTDMYPMSADEVKKIAPYSAKLRGWMVDVIVRAIDRLEPAELSVGRGTARFAVNRRKPTDKGIVNAANPDGPVDHDVPVLRVDAGGKLLAVVFGYACHNTTLQYFRWNGDYAGYAQEYVEAKHKGAVAMFWTGCGADANPLPRGTLELCRKYGKMLAEAVDDVLAGKRTPVTGTLAVRYALVELPFDRLPDKAQIGRDLTSTNQALRKRAERLKAVLDKGDKIDDHYRHYPVQVWRLGDQVTWVALGGEVVVDYARRLKKELAGGRAVWVTAYANDVMSYIPSRRVLKEGGYEADSSQIYYGMPARYAPAIEDRIVARVRQLAREVAR